MTDEQYHAEQERAGLVLTHEADRSLRATWQGAELFRYVYRPWDPQRESPRPYFHPMHTLTGRPVSLYRPHDHVWHKGISWSLSNVGIVDADSGEQVVHNFWGGPTYLRSEGGYAWPLNNGTQRHDSFDRLDVDPDAMRFDETLTWVTQPGVDVFTEQRTVEVRVLPDAQAWRLTFTTAMHNLSGDTVTFGSPTTEGRPDAGYSGLFWRGVRSFSNGVVIMPDKVGSDDLNGHRGPWLAFVGRHDGDGGGSTLLYVDHPDNPRYPTEWFVRSDAYAVVAPAPFFSREYELAADATLRLRYDVFVADGALDDAACAALATGTT